MVKGGAVGRGEGVVAVVRLLHNALQLVLEVQQHQGVTPPASPSLTRTTLPPSLDRPAIEEEVVKLFVIEVQQPVQEGRDLKRGAIVVDRGDLGSGVALERTLSKSSRSEA
jgi:hypothetical protein